MLDLIFSIKFLINSIEKFFNNNCLRLSISSKIKNHIKEQNPTIDNRKTAAIDTQIYESLACLIFNYTIKNNLLSKITDTSKENLYNYTIKLLYNESYINLVKYYKISGKDIDVEYITTKYTKLIDYLKDITPHKKKKIKVSMVLLKFLVDTHIDKKISKVSWNRQSYKDGKTTDIIIKFKSGKTEDISLKQGKTYYLLNTTYKQLLLHTSNNKIYENYVSKLIEEYMNKIYSLILDNIYHKDIMYFLLLTFEKDRKTQEKKHNK
jgi:hypothetical protein